MSFFAYPATFPLYHHQVQTAGNDPFHPTSYYYKTYELFCQAKRRFFGCFFGGPRMNAHKSLSFALIRVLRGPVYPSVRSCADLPF
jgi:hypothetical protein